MSQVCAVIFLGALLFLSACATTKPPVSKSKNLAKNAELLIGEFGYWKRDCTDRHFDIYIEQYPSGGDLRFEIGSLVIPEEPITGSVGSCLGKVVQSKKVIYVPNIDFVGTDFVSYVVKSAHLLGNKAYSVEINVQ